MKAAKHAPFSKKAVVILLASGVLLFALSILLHAYDNSPVSYGSKVKPGSYSVSAIGYAGMYDVLSRLSRPVSRGVGNTLALVGTRGILVVAEPDFERLSEEDGARFLTAPRVLLVLPKWHGREDDTRPGWIARAEPVPLSWARQTLSLLTVEADVFRDVPPENWGTNKIGVTPSISGVAQLMRSDRMRPVVGSREGMLVGEVTMGGNTVWVISDPDVMSNHGLANGDNAAFMVALFDALAKKRNSGAPGTIVFDETVHGYTAAEGSPIKLMFRFPFVVVTGLVAASALLLAIAGAGRFGAPRVPAPELDFGKARLIENGARLLDYAGYQGQVLKRYVSMTTRSAGQALHAPPGLDEGALAAWLDRIGKARKVSLSCSEILYTVGMLDAADARNLPRLFESARDIHLWKREILNGSAIHRHNR